MSGTPSMRAGHTPADGGLRASALAADLERDASNGSSSESAVSTFESLQSTAGNHAVNSLLQPPGGEALPRGVREQMEERFRFDFSGVRVHTGPAAADAAAALRAKAYTVGRDIVFSDGRFAPETTTGTQLLAHELAHVVQQSRGGAAPALDRGAPHEIAARSAANAVVGGSTPVNVSGASAIGIAREEEDEKKKPAPSAAKSVETDDIGAAIDQQTLGPAPGTSSLAQRRGDSAASDARLEEEAKDAPLMKASKARKADQPLPGGMSKSQYGGAVREVRRAQTQADVAHFGQVVHGDAPMTPEEMYRTVVSLRAFDNSLGLGQQEGAQEKLNQLEAADAVAPDKEELAALRKERKSIQGKLRRRKKAAEGAKAQASPGAKPTKATQPTDQKALEDRLAEIDKKLKQSPTERQRKQASTLKKKLAISTGQGGGAEAGIANNTYAVVQIVGPDGKVIARAAARNSASGHAEQNAIAQLKVQLRALYGGKGPDKIALPAGSRIEVMGDQVVCPAICKKDLRKFATDYGAASVVGMTYHEKRAGVTSTELTDADIEPPRPTAMRATKKGSPTDRGAAKPEDLHLREENIFDSDEPSAPSGGGKQKQTKITPASKAQTAKPSEQKDPKADPTQAAGQKSGPPSDKKPPKTAATQAANAANKQAATQAPAATKPPVQTAPPPPPAAPPQTKAPAQAKTPPAPKPTPPLSPPKAPVQTKSPQTAPPPAPPPPKPPAPKTAKAPPAPKQAPGAKGQAKAGSPKTAVAGGSPAPGVSSGPMAQSPGTALTGPPGNIAASRSFGARAVQSHGKGVQTFQNIGANGRVAIETTELLNQTPTQYRTTVTITLGATAGGGVSKESQDPKGGVGGSLSAQASGSVTATFSHVLNAEETQKYLAAIKSGSGGAHKELQIIQLATANQVEEAKTLLAQQRGTGGLAHASKNLAEGDVVSLDTEGTVAGEAGISGSQGRAGVGVQVGAHQTDRVSHTVTRHGGKNYVTVTVASEKGKSLGGSVSYMGMGVGHTAHDAAGQTESMTFELDPNAADYEARLAAITAARTPDDLKKLAARQSAVSKTTGKDQTTGGTTQVSAGPIGFAGTESGSYAEEETTTPEGVSRTYTGSGTSATQLTAGQHALAKTAKTDTITTTVGPDKKARGTTSSTNVETDWGTSIQRLASSMEDRPGATAAGLGSGETKLLQEKVDTKGKHLSDDSYARLAELAKDPAAWQKAWSGNVQTFIDWEALRKRVLAANGDREQIAKAMAEFGSKGSGRSTTVEAAVAGTGVAFEFPQSVAQQKPVYDTFVAGDALAHPRELAAAGQVNEALAELNDIKAKLTTLSREIEMHNGDFSEPAKLAEMMGRISTRSAEIRAEIRKLSAPPSPQAAVGAEAAAPTPGKKLSPVEKAAADKKTAEQAEETRKQQELAAKREEDKAKREERNAKIDLLVPQCLTLQEKERSVFAKVNAEFDSWFKSVATIFNDLNSVKSSWPHWDSLIEQLRAVYQERGDSPDRASQFAPNKGEWNRLNSRALQ